MKSLAELQALRDSMKGKIGVRDDAEGNIRVVVGMATWRNRQPAHGRCWPPLPKRFPNGTCKT